MKRAGKRTLAWEYERAKLKKEFEAIGVTSCELRYPGTCWGGYALGFAHSKKRRFITTLSDLRKVVLACNPCHDVLESLPHDLMKVEVETVISTRKKNMKKKFDLRKSLMQLSGCA